MRTVFRSWFLCACSLLAATPAAAQLRLSLGACGGGHLPSASLFADGASDGFATFGHQTGAAFGGRLTAWTNPRLGFEVEGLMAGGGIRYRATHDGTPLGEITREGQLIVGSANLLWAFYKPALEPIAMYVSLGAATLQRQGAFFDDPELSDATPDLGLVAGVGMRYGVARGIFLRVDLRNVVSTYQAVERFESRRQHDLFPTVGLDVSLLR